jgi:hypothetical protein
MSWLSICNARAAIAAALASGATYAGVTLTTPTPAPAPAPAAYTCPATGVAGNPITPGQCAYLTDLHGAGVPIVPNAVPNIRNLCSQIKTLGPGVAATNLANAWQGSQTALTVSQAQQYVSFATNDVCQ